MYFLKIIISYSKIADMEKKKYISEIPELMKEWDWEANADLDPAKLTVGSGRKVWWKCSRKHKWLSTIKDQQRCKHCPYCHGRKVLSGFNDLATTHPELTKEWNYEKNGALLPNNLKAGCNKKVWWKCSKGHEWISRITNRTYLNRNCPFCSNHKVLSGFNDLQTKYPDIAKQWDYEKNNPLLPSQVNPESPKKVWWICPKGHEWEAQINNRITGSGCPVCFKEQRTSFPEQAIFYYLSKYFKNTENRYLINKIECDIYLKDFNISVEYDGGRFHKNIQKDINKIKKLQQLGIKTINIRDHKCPQISAPGALIYKRQNETLKDLEKAILFIFLQIDKTVIPDINLERDRVAILENSLSIEKQNSVVNLNPKFLKEWHYEKNGKLKPEFFTVKSGKKVWWKCSKGHEWLSSVRNRQVGNNCPYCSHQKLLPGYNDLETIHPELAKEWNYEKNFPLTPRDYITGSNKLVWWKCSKGHEWRASIANRVKGTKCPYCSNQKVQVGFNDLATTHPDLAKEWDYEKNAPLLPTQFTAGSNKKFWWKCSKGHEWKVSVSNRKMGKNCPYCSNQKILVGYNDFASQHPEFLKEWDYEKNNPLLPTQVTSGSQKMVWWKCSKCGRKWQATVCNRVKCHNLCCHQCNLKESKRNKNQLSFDFRKK